jgi:hypothetical protein
MTAASKGTIKVIVCSTDFDPKCLLENEELLPEGPPWPHPLTQLPESTVAVCDWIEDIHESEIQAYGGEIPPSTLRNIYLFLRKRYGTTDVNLLPSGGHTPLP